MSVIRGKAAVLILSLISLLGVTGCWDMTEINQLAIGNLAGGDIDPETGRQIVYYQIVNPSALASQKGGGIKSPVYTYKVEAPTLAELAFGATDMLPRDLFPDHFQAYLLTERMARRGLHSYLNFLERQSNRRTDLDLIITDSPMKDVMNTYTLFERIPGRSLRALFELQYKVSGRVNPKSRIKDVIEHMESSVLTVLPIISLRDSHQASTTGRYEHIDANRGSLFLSGGAVIRKDRMIGKLSLTQIPLYNLMKNEAKVYYDKIEVNGKDVDVGAIKVKVRKRLSLVNDRPVLRVDVYADLKLLNTEQSEALSSDSLGQIKQAFNDQLADKAADLFEWSRSKGWDLFSIEHQMGKKRGKEWREALNGKEAWKQAKLEMEVRSKVTDMGAIIDPY
ncbi:Ger(x)C family spore germination protein [Cohnella sp.]|uniref:Ger(x)C family spore germination protein n=1 Tax=Cohnella sp. TaxID=1883426 RepID=UPI003567AAE7